MTDDNTAVNNLYIWYNGTTVQPKTIFMHPGRLGRVAWMPLVRKPRVAGPWIDAALIERCCHLVL